MGIRGGKDMSWVDRILNSNAGKCAREKAEKLIKEAGGSILTDSDGLSGEVETSEPSALREGGSDE